MRKQKKITQKLSTIKTVLFRHFYLKHYLNREYISRKSKRDYVQFVVRSKFVNFTPFFWAKAIKSRLKVAFQQPNIEFYGLFWQLLLICWNSRKIIRILRECKCESADDQTLTTRHTISDWIAAGSTERAVSQSIRSKLPIIYF